MSKQAKILLIVNGLFTLAIGLSNVFVNIFLWKKSNDFVVISFFQLMQFIFTPLAFIVAGWLSKKKNGIWPLRIGVVFFAITFLFILLVRNTIADYVYILGILFGIASGFYWLAFHVLSFDFTSLNNRDTFNGFNGFIMNAAGAIAPLAAAYIIEINKNTKGYFIVFLISLILFVIQILISLLLRSKNYKDNLNFKKIFNKNNEEWSNLRKATAAWGLRDITLIFVVSILIYETTGSEMSLGKLTFFAYIISCGAYLFEQKIIKPQRRVFSMYLGSIFLLISIIGLVFDINYTFLVFYMIVSSIFVPFFIVPMTSKTFNTLSINHEETLRIEYIINKEIFLNTGRILSTIILICLLSFFNIQRVLNYYILFIGSAQIISLYYLRKIKTWEL